ILRRCDDDDDDESDDDDGSDDSGDDHYLDSDREETVANLLVVVVTRLRNFCNLCLLVEECHFIDDSLLLQSLFHLDLELLKNRSLISQYIR
ncbi:hypothetical protein PMAYCL1PPCAC_11754, partial [Pristionchus mayeri]